MAMFCAAAVVQENMEQAKEEMDLTQESVARPVSPSIFSSPSVLSSPTFLTSPSIMPSFTGRSSTITLSPPPRRPTRRQPRVDALRKVECAEKVVEEQARFGQMIAEIMEESRQRYLVAEALGLRPAHDPPLERDPRFAEAWNEVVIARRQRDARTANMRDLESASSAVPSQMQSRLPETSKHDQVGLEAEVHTDATIHLDASEKDTMYGSEPSSVPFTYEQPRMGKRRIDMMTAETALAAGAPLSHPSLKVFRTAHDPPRAFRLGTLRPVRRQMAEAAAAWETPVMPQQTSIEDLIANQSRSATIIDAPVYRSEPPASAPAPVAEDAAAGDVDDAIIVDHTEWDRRFKIAEARRQERQPQAEPGLEPEPEAEDATGILSKLSSWARSAMAWVKEKVWAQGCLN
ncbi:hypothetical protein LTR32_003797 [Rachicladosporium monterosium]|uniref:Uncharacterized protein n=1 Tax=Rachicladosporium monterosium TaxID=1507873 RepID=A0ABR0L6J1_9PEZI|nr:hypothetical protein LTR32_003797 [Rachicladosporium monterosium]